MQDVFELAGVLGTIASTGLFVYLGVRLIGAFSDRLERRGGPAPEVIAELDDLRARVHDLEAGHDRLAELEERLDFAERLLTSQANATPLLEERKS
ncbi:MAG TPA: hypothetical protein VF037_00630 [Gemmatimonadales bacterium]